MAARYISRRYGSDLGHESRTSSVSRDSTWTTRNSSLSRGASQVPDVNSLYSSSFTSTRSRSSTPVGGRYQRSISSDYNMRGSSTNMSTVQKRDPLFSDFVQDISKTLPGGSTSLYNSSHLSHLKDQFQSMIQDNWERKQCNDPSVCHDMALKTTGWSNYLDKAGESSSNVLGRKHSRLENTQKFHMPRITVYHRSTFE